MILNVDSNQDGQSDFTLSLDGDFSGRLVTEQADGNTTIRFASILADGKMTGTVEADIIAGSLGNDIVLGGNGADQILGREGEDALHGGGGADTLFGGPGQDRYEGGPGADLFAGKPADLNGEVIADFAVGDTLRFDGVRFTAFGLSTPSGAVILQIDTDGDGAKETAVTLEGSFPGTFQATPSAADSAAFTDVTYRAPVAEIIGTKHGDRLIGGDPDERIDGRDGDDRIDGNGGDDTLLGGNGNDRINAGDGNDSIDGGAGNDRLDAGDGADTVLGGVGKDSLVAGAGDDRVEAGDGNDTIDGYDGADTLLGGNGADTLCGGAGADMLIGGAGKDVFDFEEIGYSPAGMGRDVIIGFEGAGRAIGDCIDLGSIDANLSRCGDQAFRFIGLSDFFGAAQLRIAQVGGDTLIQGNVDANLAADFEILVAGVDPHLTPLTSADFLL